MSSSSSYENRLIYWVRRMAAVLFSGYSYLFLLLGFPDLLGFLGSEYAQMIGLETTISPWIIAGLMVLALQSIQFFLRLLFRIRTSLLLFTYLPSLAGLLLLVWIGEDGFSEESILVHQAIVGGMALALFCIYGSKSLLTTNQNNRELRESIHNFPTWRTYNLALFSLLLLLIGLLSPMKQSLRDEASMLRAVKSNQLTEVLSIDSTNPRPSLQMTRLRNQALLQNGNLGERFFTYPQLYGTKGLSKVMDETQDKQAKADLPLIKKLLDKDIEGFMPLLAKYAQNEGRGKILPTHYLEAYALYTLLHPEQPNLIEDATLRKRFQSYLKERNQYHTTEERHIALQNTEFKGTYWFYYEYN